MLVMTASRLFNLIAWLGCGGDVKASYVVIVFDDAKNGYAHASLIFSGGARVE